MAKVLKPFLFQGRVVHPGEVIQPDEQHEKQLAAGGLVEASPRRAPAKKASPKARSKPPVVGEIKSGDRPRRRQPILGSPPE